VGSVAYGGMAQAISGVMSVAWHHNGGVVK